jgi:cell wall-associated NlpC family hydrolase
MRRNWLARSALVLLPAAAAGALTAVATQPSAAYQASPAYHVSSAFYAAPAAPVAAQLTASTESIGARILDEAETRTGDWYVYGGAGPSVFDCSGLVYWASHKLGVNMPRTTYGMLGSSLLYRVSSPRRGDLAFYGTGHVEIVTTWAHTTFGAQNAGTRVGWHSWNAYWHPTMYFRIR